MAELGLIFGGALIAIICVGIGYGFAAHQQQAAGQVAAPGGMLDRVIADLQGRLDDGKVVYIEFIVSCRDVDDDDDGGEDTIYSGPAPQPAGKYTPAPSIN